MTAASASTLARLLSFCLLALSLMAFFLGVELGRTRFVILGFVALVLAGGSWALARQLRAGTRRTLETRREQRLWRSGPLGRRWLGSRRRTP